MAAPTNRLEAMNTTLGGGTNNNSANTKSSPSRNTPTGITAGASSKRWRRRPDEEEPSPASPPRSSTSTWFHPTTNQSPTSSTASYISTAPASHILRDTDNDDVLSDGGNSWTKRIPWLRLSRNRSNSHGGGAGGTGDANTPGGDGLYYDQSTVSDGMLLSHDLDPNTAADPHKSSTTLARFSSSSFMRTWSNLSRASAGEQSTVHDFDHEEWTPPDSAYGAACPVCGCLPKNVRRAIEATLIGTLAIVLIYFLVTTSIKLTNENNVNNNNNGNDGDGGNSGLNLDDDYYTPNSNQNNNYFDDKVDNNDDDYSVNDDYFDETDDDDGAAADDDGNDDGDGNDGYDNNNNNDDNYYSEDDDGNNDDGRRRYLRQAWQELLLQEDIISS